MTTTIDFQEADSVTDLEPFSDYVYPDAISRGLLRLALTSFLLGLAFVCFVLLQLVGVIHWSWWLVTVPVWGPTLTVVASALVLTFIGAMLPSKGN